MRIKKNEIFTKMRNLMSHFLDCHQLAKINLENDFKTLLYFCDLVLNLKVKGQLTEVKFHLKIRYFFNQSMDIHQTCMNISL